MSELLARVAGQESRVDASAPAPDGHEGATAEDAARDPLTAPSTAVPTSRGKDPSLSDCARVFARQPSPPYLLGAFALALAARAAQGQFTWRDLVMVAGLVALTPFVEWAIHVYLLHARPFTLMGHKVEILSAREHRAHHEAPAVLEGVLIPVYAVLIFLVMIAAINWALSFPIHIVLGGPRLAYATTSVATSFAILAAYEWTHFLIHTPHRARSRYYRAIWRNHRLHHYKNERYWFGVTSTVGDRVIGTLPDQRAVPRSATARSLHGES
jgi:hypothetical protein